MGIASEERVRVRYPLFNIMSGLCVYIWLLISPPSTVLKNATTGDPKWQARMAPSFEKAVARKTCTKLAAPMGAVNLPHMY